MKKYLLIICLLVGIVFQGCDNPNILPNGYVEVTQDGAESFILKGYENSSSGFTVFQPEGFNSPFYIREKNFVGAAYDFMQVDANRLDEITELPKENEWVSIIPIVEKKVYWARYKEAFKYYFIKFRVAKIEANNVIIEYIVSDKTQNRPNDNINANTGYENISVTGYEIPHLNSQNVYVDHYVTLDGKSILNYSLEWDAEKQHSAWVAYSVDAITSQVNVERADDAWAQDPGVPEGVKQPEEENHKSDGYDKGHLCASADRLYSEDANRQTFYYTNISPQISSFNQGFWAELENQVQKWAKSCQSGTFDKLYVTKGGTLNKLLLNFTGNIKAADGKYPTTDDKGFTPKGLACPQYYFMAILGQKGEYYNAIGFLVPHQENLNNKPSVAELKNYAVSIDDLEKETGLDFFCNLPDLLENQVESSYDLNVWGW